MFCRYEFPRENKWFGKRKHLTVWRFFGAQLKTRVINPSQLRHIFGYSITFQKKKVYTGTVGVSLMLICLDNIVIEVIKVIQVMVLSTLILLMDEILHHLEWLKPYKWWDNHHPWWCRILSINSMSHTLHWWYIPPCHCCHVQHEINTEETNHLLGTDTYPLQSPAFLSRWFSGIKY